MPFSILFILLCLLHIRVEAAEVIERVSVIRSDDTQSLPSSPLAKSQKTAVLAPADATVGDKLVLDAGKSGKYIISVLESRTTQFGNTIIHGQTPSGGASMLVVSDAGRITGNFYRYDGKVRVSTSEDRVITAWREGIDSILMPIDSGGVVPQTAAHSSTNSHVRPKTLRASKLGEASLTAQADSSNEAIYPRFSVGRPEIDILLFYDDGMVDPLSTADYVMEIANTTFENSNVAIRAAITKAIPVEILSTSSNRDLLYEMNDATSVFSDIAEERAVAEADLVMLLRGDKAEREGNCGIAYQGVYEGNHKRSSYEGVAEWRPKGSGGGWSCSEETFAHELGHLLGLAHRREDQGETIIRGATSYAWAYGNEAFHTVMSADVGSGRLQKWSSPDLDCNGQPCGVDSTKATSADNAKALINTGPLIAANSGSTFAADSIAVRRYLGKSSCGGEYENEEGEFRGTLLRNNSGFDLQMHSSHYVRADGTEQTYSRTDYTVPSSGFFNRGFCRGPDEENPIGSTYVSTYYRYVHPQSGEIVETLHVPWEEGFRNNHSVVRIAYSEGGQLYGHSERLIEAGQTTEIRFDSILGYELNEISGSCNGEWDGTTYLVSVTEDDCRVEVTFNKVFDTFTITPSADGNGTIDVMSAQTLRSGSSFSVTATPDPGYKVSSIVTDCDGVASGNTYTIANVTKDCSITFTFREIRFYDVTITAFEGGDVDQQALSVEEDAVATILITPDYAYLIDEVTGSCGGSLAGTTYTTEPITVDCYIDVTFKVDVGVRASEQFLKLLNLISNRSNNSG